MIKWILNITSAIVLSCVLAQISIATTYEIYDLNPLGAYASSKTQINNQGEIVAFEQQEISGYRMFFYNPITKVRSDADCLDMVVYDMNDNRQVIGKLTGGSWGAAVWDPAYGLTDFGALGLGWNSSSAAINENGVVVGIYQVSGDTHGFYWTRSSGIQDIGVLGKWLSGISDINDAGYMVGSFDTTNGDTHAFIKSLDGKIEDLGTLGGNYSQALGINNNGLVFGISEINDTKRGLFLWDKDNGMRPAFTCQDQIDITFAAMNDNGWIVGYGSFGGFIWNLEEGLTINEHALYYDINNAGQITGVLYDRPVLWNPVPEPSSILALVGGIAGLGGFALKRRRS